MIGPADERAGFPRYQFGLADEKIEKTRQPLDGLPTTDRDGKAKFTLTLEKQPEATRPLEAQLTVRMAEAGGRAVERKLVVPVTPAGPMIGVKPLFSGRSLGEGENATFDVIVAAPDGATLARSGLRYELLKVETRYQWYRRDTNWEFEPVKTTRRVADGTSSTSRPTRRRASRCRCSGAAIASKSRPAIARPDDLGRLRRRLLCGSERRYARPARNRARQAGICARRHA